MDDDHEGKKILVIQTHGVETPRRTYSPLFYAMAAAAMEMDVLVWFTMDGTNQLKKGAAEKVQLDPTSDVTLKTMLEQPRPMPPSLGAWAGLHAGGRRG